MERPESIGCECAARPAAAVVVRPCAEHEAQRFKDLMAKHHYLKGGRSAGDTLRYVAEVDGQWVGLLTWGAAAYRLKHREEWIGWGAGLRRARLKLVVQNRRFCLLTKAGEVPNLASQVLGACLRRLQTDWLEHFEYAPLVAESFVDPNYFQATCYKATNWRALGLTAGSGRHARDFYQEHGTPKTLWVKELIKDARLVLADPAPLPAAQAQAVRPTGVVRSCASFASCRSLHDVFVTLPDPRAKSGRRYKQSQLLSILALGMLSGCRDLKAIVIMGQHLSQNQLSALGGRRRRKTGCFEVPSYNAYYNLIGQMDADAFDLAITQWLNAREGILPRDLAIDGKVLRGTTNDKGFKLELIALVENKTQRLVGQEATQVLSEANEDKQEGELTAGRRLLHAVPTLDGATVTADALYTVADLAKTIVQDKGGDYLFALKGDQPTLHEHVQKAFASSHAGAQRPLFGEAT